MDDVDVGLVLDLTSGDEWHAGPRQAGAWLGDERPQVARGPLEIVGVETARPRS